MDTGPIFKAIVWESLSRIALDRLFQAVPFLGWGPVGYIVGWIARKYGGMLFDEIYIEGHHQITAFKNEAHRKAYEKSMITLRAIGATNGIDSKQFQEARNEAKARFSALVSSRDK
jgi:hypothetical protein